MRILISGGCKNRKSDYAQRLAKAMCPPDRPLYYVATMRPVDGEDTARIRRHQAERAGWGFVTIEQPTDIHHLIKRCHMGGSFLIDSLTALLMNEMFPLGGQPFIGAEQKLLRELGLLLDAAEHLVVVSDGIYSDAVAYPPLTEAYRRTLAYLERDLAARCEVVLEASFGHIICHRGQEAVRSILKEAGL